MRWNQDILADHMVVRRPVGVEIRTAISHSGDVVDQRIKPHISHVIFVEWQWNPPRESFLRPGNAQIVQVFFQKLNHLLLPERWYDEIGIVFQMLDQLLLVFFKRKEIILLGDLGHFSKHFRPLALDFIFFLYKLFRTLAVKSSVFPEVYFAFVFQFLQKISHHLFVFFIRGANVVVVGNFKILAQRVIAHRHLVTELLRINALFHCGHLHLLPMFIQSGQEVNLVASGSAIARDHVGQHLLVGVPDMRGAVGVINCGSEIKTLHALLLCEKCNSTSEPAYCQC